MNKLNPQIIIGSLAILLSGIGVYWPEAFSLERGDLFPLWTGLTSHWVHWNGSHLFWSLGIFLFLLGMWPKEKLAEFSIGVLASSVAISLAFHLTRGGPAEYGGLSGIDSSLSSCSSCFG